MEILFVPIEKLEHGHHRGGDALDLQQSLVESGLLQDLIVEAMPDGTYQVHSGNRRLTALRVLVNRGVEVPGLDYRRIPCRVVSGLGEAERILLRFTANVQQEEKPSDKAKALATLMLDKRLTLERVAAAIGITPAQAQIYLRLAVAGEDLQRKVDSGEMSLSAFWAIADAPATVKRELTEKSGRVTVATAKAAVKRARPEQMGLPAGFGDDDSVVRLNEARAIVAEVLAGDFGMRERHVLNGILGMLVTALGEAD